MHDETGGGALESSPWAFHTHNKPREFGKMNERTKEHLYRCNIGIIKKLAFETARRYNFDSDELLGHAHLVFSKACEQFDETADVKFSTYLYSRLRPALPGYVQKQRAKSGVQLDLEKHDVAEAPGINTLLDSLSEDAAKVVELVLNTPGDLAEMIHGKGGHPSNWRSVLRRFLRKDHQYRWSRDQINQVFDEIGQLT